MTEADRRETFDEVTIVSRAQDGDVEAFGVLVEEYTPRLYRFAVRMMSDRTEAEDAVQDGFVQAWRNLPGLTNPAAFSSWIYRIVRNRCAEISRQRTRHKVDTYDPNELPDEAHTHRPPTDPADRSMQDATMAQLNLLVSQLPEDLRVCWLLADVEGMSYAEIAAIVLTPVSTVRGRIARSRQQLAEGLRAWH